MATALNIPTRFFNLPAFLLFLKKTHFHTQQFGLLFPPPNSLKHFEPQPICSVHQTQIIGKNQRTGHEQRVRTKEQWLKIGKESTKWHHLHKVLWTENTKWLECFLRLMKWNTGIPISFPNKQAKHSTCGNMPRYQRAASSTVKTCTDVCIDTTRGTVCSIYSDVVCVLSQMTILSVWTNSTQLPKIYIYFLELRGTDISEQHPYGLRNRLKPFFNPPKKRIWWVAYLWMELTLPL